MSATSRAPVRPFLAALLVALSAPLAAQQTVVTFDDPPPPGAPDSFLNGVYQGLDFGTSQWRWSPPYGSDPTNNVYFGAASGSSRSFTFAAGPRVLNSVNVYTTQAGTMTLSDGVNTPVTRNVTVGSMQLVTTGWTQPATTVTVAFTAGWALGVDDITYSVAGPADTVPPTVTMTAPPAGALLSGVVTLSADASDNVGVAGVQFYVDGAPLGSEDTFAPYTASWDTNAVANGTHTLTARARDGSGNETLSAGVVVTVENSVGAGFGYSLSFNGTGAGDADRVKIRIDDPATNSPGPPADVGATDFTIEFWINGTLAANPAPAIQCGATDNWKFGNIIIDRDRFNQPRAYGISVAGGRVTFGVRGDGNAPTTICGTTNVLDGQWHHVAVQRRRNDGWMWLYVDGVLQAQADGPNGDISYPDNGVPGNFCNGPCINSDPFIVIGAEKHDAGPEFPSYAGLFDELHISNVLRYSGSFSRPVRPFSPSPSTVALYHFDEGEGDFVGDSSGAFGGPSDGERRTGGLPGAVAWVTQTPFNVPPASVVGQWTGVYNWPLVAVHSTLLRNGQVLVFDGATDMPIGGVSARVWNPATGAFTPVPNDLTDLFCSGHSLLHDGRVLVTGGNVNLYIGLVDTNIFDPVSATWTRVANMANRRWYPTNLTLSDGRVLTVSGTTTCLDCTVLIPEIYDPQTNTWDQLTGASQLLPLYPHLFQLPDGRVLVPGSDEDPMATYVLDVDNEEWSVVDPDVIHGGAAVMYEPGRVMKTGSAADVDRPTEPSVNTTYVLDMNEPSPEWRQTESMEFPRSHHNLTLLPDGTALVTGGGRSSDGVNLSLAVFEAELWSPETESWTTMAPAQRPRLYHSTAVLLPDGRVLTAGGGRFVGFPNIDQLSAEIFSPPYLFRGERPRITSAPQAAAVGETFFVGNADPDDIERVTLLAPGAVTHQVNMHQRFVSLSFERTGNGLFVTLPANANVVPPGYYMLFLINGRGVPSIASFIQVVPQTSPTPVPVITDLTPDGAEAGSGAFTLTVAGSNFVDGSTVRWNGAARPTTFVSANQLTAAIGAADVATAGSASVTVLNPAPGGGVSNALSFTIDPAPNPVPVTTGVEPASVAAGGPSFVLTVNGSGFVNGSVVRWNGANRTTTFVSASQLTALIPAADIATVGEASVTVFTGAPGGGTSNAQIVTIDASANPQPATTSIAPASATAGSGAFALTVNGSGFVAGSIVRWNGANRTTSFVSESQLTAAITAADVATAGAASVTVFTPPPGGGTSNAQTFTIEPAPNPVPVTSSISPATVTAGTGAFQLTVNGADFVNGSVVRVNGANRSTTFVSATQLTATVTAADVAAAGTAAITVFTPAPGGGTSNAQTLTIEAGGETPAGLVAAYGFNEGSGTAVSDASGNGNAGTLNGATWTASGRYGAALVFNGTSNWVTVPDSASLDLNGPLSLEAWVYPTAAPTGWRTVIAKEQSGGTTYFLHASSSSANRPATGVFAAGAERSLIGGNQLAANTWVHLAATYDGTTQRLYVNGVQVASRAQTGAVAVSNGALRIGGNSAWGEYFQGRIDEVRIYNRALTQAEIQADMNAPVGP